MITLPQAAMMLATILIFNALTIACLHLMRKEILNLRIKHYRMAEALIVVTKEFDKLKENN